MRNGAKQRLVSLLMALVMAASLAVLPASADSSAPSKTPITITVENYVRAYRQDNPAAWSYSITEGALREGDSIEDLVEGPPVCAANSKSGVGEYNIRLIPKQQADNYDITVVNGTLTVVPASVTSFRAEDESFIKYGYWRTIYANSDNNSVEGLARFLAAEKGIYEASCGRETVKLKASWSADGNVAFDPKGQRPNGSGDEVWYDWYSYTADLATQNAAEADNFEIEAEPKAYIRVIPVNAVQTLERDSATLTADDVQSLTDQGMEAALGLPKTASVTYLPTEDAGEFKADPGEYKIEHWEMEGSFLSPSGLKARAADLAAVQETAVTLTPVYATDTAPDWATLEEAPGFTLTITGKSPVAVTVTPPADITYGETLEDPAAKQTAIGKGGIDESGTFTYRYVGVNGTKYDGEDKPTAAGDYRVTAVLESTTHSGRATSSLFTIRPKCVTYTGGITGTTKVYDGSTNANAALNTAKANISGKLENDDLHIAASGYFVDKNVGTDKEVVIIDIALAGEDAGNYTLANPGQRRTKASITPKPLEIDDSGITVTKMYDSTRNPGTLKGALKLKGVIGGEAGLDMSNVIAGSYTDTDAGENKTVILSGLALTGSKTVKKNYSLQSVYTFHEAEIATKPRPVLGTHFTVAIPRASAYDGQPREAAVEAENGVILGKATVTYTKQTADGTYGAPTTEKPVNAGIYKVMVSFEESADFAAAEGRNAIEAGTLTIIRRISGTASADITIPAAALRTVRLNELRLEPGMAQGVKLKKALSVAGSEALKEVTGAAGKTFFTLETNKAEDNQSQTFQLLLRSDNYVALTVNVTINADVNAIDIIPPKVVDQASFPYGTPLKDMIELTGGSAALNGESIPGTFVLKEPDQLYEVGMYANENIDVLFNSDDGMYQDYPITVHATFTITEVIDEFAPIYLLIYANSSYNTDAERLTSFVAEKKPTYIAENAVTLKASWRADNNTRFQPKGKVENVWYSYTADLTAEDGDFDVSGIDKPKAYVRVIPVNAAPALEKSSATLTAAAVKALTDENDLKAALGLPDTVCVTYAPAETFEWTAEAFTEASGVYAISGWKMDSKPLTPAALKKKAARAARRDMDVTLTPIFTAPDWATITGIPTFKLTITP